MDSFLLKLLNYLELTPEDYDKLRAPVTVRDLPDVSAFTSYFDFIARIELAIERDEEVLIYGDYDADGILATSIFRRPSAAEENYGRVWPRKRNGNFLTGRELWVT